MEQKHDWFDSPYCTQNYLYLIALQESLYNHPTQSLQKLLNTIHARFRFNTEQFYFVLTGIPKCIYQKIYGLNADEYMEIFYPLKEQIEAVLFAQSWTGDVFLAWKEDEKQIAVIMSPKEAPRCDAQTLAQTIGDLVQLAYEKKIFKGDRRYRNTTSLCGPLSGYDAIREGYAQARRMNDLSSFLFMDGRVMTQALIEKEKSNADYAMVLDRCMRLRSFVDAGDEVQTEKQLKSLFLSLLRGGYSLALCDDALAFLKSMLQIRCSVYRVRTTPSIDDLCSRKSYLKIEECVEALLPVLLALCQSVQKQGANSKSVLSARYYIEQHYTEYIVLDDIAQYAGTNSSYLSGKFKEEVGLSIKNYITQIRLESAKALLLADKKPVAQIAASVGYEDVRYFTRLFKQAEGCTPTAYRKKHAAAEKHA